MNRRSALVAVAASALVVGMVTTVPAATASEQASPSHAGWQLSEAQRAPSVTAESKPGGKAFAVSISASTSEPVLGDRVVLKGRVTPVRKAAGEQATLQQRLVGAKRWASQDADRISKRGRYRLADTPSTVQARQYRVIVPAVGRVDTGHSRKVLVTVYRWQDLASVEERASRYFEANVGVEIDAVPYARSLAGETYAPAGYIDYNLTRRCLELRARYGLGDDSDERATALIEVSADGATLYSRSFALTESAPRTLPLRGVFRLKFAFTTSNPDVDPQYQTGAQAVVAGPRVLCSF